MFILQASTAIMSVFMRDAPKAVLEKASIDEVYLDVTCMVVCSCQTLLLHKVNMFCNRSQRFLQFKFWRTALWFRFSCQHTTPEGASYY